MPVDPVMQRAELVVRRLQGQGSAELRLSAGTLEKDDQVAGDGERHGAAEVFFHQRQRQIDPGRHPGRGPDRTVAHEDRIGLDMHGGKRWASLAQYFQWVAARRPSNTPAAASRNAPVQTEATRRASVARCRTQSTSTGFSAAASTPSPPATSKVSSASPRCVSGACRKRHAGRGCHGLAALRHDPEHVRPRASGAGDEIVGGGEHLNRPRDIEQLHRRVGEHVDDADRVWRGARGLWHFRQTMPA